MKKVNDYSLNELLKKIFGFDSFKGNQEAIINNLLEGRDTFVIMPTGGGKSMCYQLPAIISPGTAIIISPLIALMKNQVDAIRNFGAEQGIAHFLNSSLSKAEIAEVRKDSWPNLKVARIKFPGMGGELYPEHMAWSMADPARRFGLPWVH